MPYGDFKVLIRGTASNKILPDKQFDIAKNSKYDGYQRGFTSTVYKCFNKKSSGSSMKNENISKKRLAEKLHKPSIRKSKKNKSILIFYRQYLGCWFSWYEINK